MRIENSMSNVQRCVAPAVTPMNVLAAAINLALKAARFVAPLLAAMTSTAAFAQSAAQSAAQAAAQSESPPAAQAAAQPAASNEATESVPAEQVAFFEKKIRPVLVVECFSCHSTQDGKKPKGGLALDSHEGLQQGGESGPVIVPGEPGDSLLIQAMRHSTAELAMPPKKKLDAQVVADFEQWVRLGAHDPRPASRAEKPTRWEPSVEEGRSHWAFQPPRSVSPPAVKNAEWPRTDIDRFVLSALEAEELAPNADADRGTLLRRLSFDLTGLPPTPADIQAFLADSSPEAWKNTVDRLIDSPQFGEKWARHWLDIARYAESTGKTVNFTYPQAWRYRDYVIAAFNSDKPYDQFIQEQLAGDLMPSDDPRITAERIVATGFLAIGPKTLNERNGVKFELDVVDEQIDVTTQAFLGVTAACARCHDHKFDPIPQTDYYALAGIFRSTETCYGTVTFINAQRKSSLVPLPADANMPVATGNLTDDERRRIERQIQSVRDSMQDSKDGLQRFFATGQISLLQARLDAYDADGNPKRLAMGVRDKPARSGSGFGFGRRGDRAMGFAGFSFDGSRWIADSPVYARGESDQPSDKPVPRGALQVVSSKPLQIPPGSSGRLELARWIASRDNPLTARVIVNRIWLQLFGRGLVPTPDDFGMAGRPPTHPELLDHLALRFMDDGWSIKKFIRYLVASRTYQLGSQADRRAREVDPDNRLLWRMTPRRLDAEVLRDSLLAVSGQLASTSPVGSVVARTGEGPVNRPRFGGDPIAAAINDPRDTHRSIYLPIIRDNLPEAMSLFDAADPALITSDRQQTTVPSQGLYLLNNAFVLRAADAAADRLLEKERPVERIREAFERFLGRSPTEREQTGAEAFLAAYEQKLTESGVSKSRRDRELWSAFCQSLFATAEFQYRR